MRVKVTKKEIMKNYKCFSVGYCNLQTLLGKELVSQLKERM